MKKYISIVLVITSFVIFSCVREYTCECVETYNNVKVGKIVYTAEGQTEKELCDDADREQNRELTEEVLDSLNSAGLNLSYPADTLVIFKRTCEAK